MNWEQIYQTRVRSKIKFIPQDFYEKFKKFLEGEEWEGIFKKDRYEKYYYHKLTPDGLLFIEAQWEMYKNYWKEEPKIDWKLEITILVNGYNINTLVGDLDISIKSSHNVEDFREPNTSKSKGTEKILLSFGFKKIMKGLVSNLERVRGKKKLIDMSGRDLYNESEKIKDWIIDYFKLYKY
ncbi:MAG: hypothetical protein ACP5GJ_01875 [Nanopusillaceae archaeon]|jgi:hypothetical protein